MSKNHDRWHRIIRKEARIIAVLALAGAVCLLGFAMVTGVYAVRAQSSVADNVVRLHIVANSDDYDDVRKKHAVRDAILAHMETVLAQSEDKQGSLNYIQSALPELERIAGDVLGGRAQASLGRSFFPKVAYGPLRIPSGEYTALRIYLGEADGSNWWCVMFPPLCFVEEATAEVSQEGLELFASAMPDYAYELVAGDTPTTEVRLAIVEWWNNRD